MSDTVESNTQARRTLDRGQQWLEQLLKLARFPTSVEAKIPDIHESDLAYPEQSDSYWLIIDDTKLAPAQIEVLIGPEGTTLDAIQYLANSILNMGQEREQQGSYTIELNGYRARRQAELRSLAEEAAKLVRETGQEVEMKSLSSAERRQVHNFFQDCEDIETYSRGQEPDRRLVVRLRN